MEWYVLDDQLRKVELIEGYESMIWTERYSAWGDFELKTNSLATVRKMLIPETWIAFSESARVMKVETVTDAVDDNGARILDIVGRSTEALLDDRVAMPAVGDLTTTPTWILTGVPGDIAREIFTTICVDFAIDAGDGIPFYSTGTLLPHGAIAEPADSITVSLNPDSVYNSIKLVCDTYNLGFRIVYDFSASKAYFEVYTGEDRTSDQSDNAAIIFSPDLDNFDDQTTLKSSANLKNVAYVFAQNGAATVYDPDTDSSVSGAQRRALIVDASDIDTASGPDLDLQLTQRGLQELGARQVVYQFDGQISQNSPLVYGVDYNLGDLVEERDSDDNGNQMRVTEQIFVSDAEGDRSYPTLAVNQVITPGSWNAWSATQTWDDLPTSEHWDDI